MGTLEELEWRIQILEDSKSYQNFQIKDPYSIFQEEHTDLEKSTESMIQFQSDPLNMIEARLSRLENMYRNKKLSLPTILDTSSDIDENKESKNLEEFDQNSILSHKLELDQFKTLIKLASFSFNEIELEWECDPDPQSCDSVPIFESMLTLIYPICTSFPSQHLFPYS